MVKIIDRNSATPAYQQLKIFLVDAMQSGEFATNSKIPSENMLGKQYGIHRHTARTALKHLESEGLINSVPGRGWFVCPNIKSLKLPTTSQPADTKSLVIGFYGITAKDIHSHFSTSFFNELLQQSIINNIELKMLSNDDMRQLQKQGQCRYELDGLLWAFPQPDEINDLEVLHHAGIDIIVANRQVFGAGVPYIATDQYAGTRELVTRLTKAGHRRIACITSDAPYRYVSERYRGYCDALHDAGLEVDEKLVLHIHDIENFPKKLAKFFAESKELSAIFLAGEIFHAETLDFLKQTKRRIPEDISVVAFDKVTAHPTNTNIICLEQPAAELVREVFNSFRQINQGGKIPTGKVLNPIIVLGSSIKNINKIKTTELRTAIAV